MTRVVLVRHGQSSWNVEGRVQGRTDFSVLTEQGERQAQATALALADVAFDGVYASPLQRARQTVERILASRSELNIQFSEDLLEIDLPGWEGLNHLDLAARFPEAHRVWIASPHLLALDGFQPLASLWEQARRFWERCLSEHPKGSILVVAHNAINKALLCTALGLPERAYPLMAQSNCGINVLNFDTDRYAQLESLNLTAHTGKILPDLKRGVRLLLVRHGETDWNRAERFQGQIDVPLNARGEQQAHQAAEFLKGIPIDRAYSSPLLRPKATAEKILSFHPEVTLQLVPPLQEICHGQWEGKFRAEIDLLYPGLLDLWQSEPHRVQMPDGENLAQVWQRAMAAWREIVHETAPEGTSLVVAHDAINKAIVASALGLGPEDFWRFKQGNGSVTAIDYPEGADGQAQLSAVNVTSHLGGVLDRTAAGAL